MSSEKKMAAVSSGYITVHATFKNNEYVTLKGQVYFVIIDAYEDYLKLRFSQTLITWLWSLSAILPLCWRHDMAEHPPFPAKTWET